MLAGCTQEQARWLQPQTRPASNPPATQPAAADAFSAAGHSAFSDARPIMLQVRFDVFRASVPLGEVSNSGKIWNHVEEDMLPADAARNLQRNGIRTGRGSTSSWAPIRAILDATRDVRTRSDGIIARNGSLTLDVNPVPRDQVLFLYRPGGGMAGATFARSTTGIRIEYAIPPTELDSVALWIMPEIRQRYLEPGWQVTRDGVQPRETEASRILRELAFQVVVPPDHFILLGPSPQVQRQLLVGSALLAETIDGRAYESLYFITPQVVRIGGPPPAPRGDPRP